MANFNELFDRAAGTVRGGIRQATRLGRNAVNTGVGLSKRVRGGGAKADMDDTTLARKVETEIFRGASARKGKIDVNVVEGVVWLRGEAKNAAEIKSVEAKVRSIPEVRGVENLLHQPKTPAPSRTKSGSKKTTTSRAAAKKSAPAKKPTAAKSSAASSSGPSSESAPRKFERAATNEEKQTHTSDAEPAPTDLAARREGRKPAPLGSTKESDTSSAAAATGGTTPSIGNGSSGGGGSSS